MLLKKDDSLRDAIEKMSLIPESKLVYVESFQGLPKVKNILTVYDIFSKIGNEYIKADTGSSPSAGVNSSPTKASVSMTENNNTDSAAETTVDTASTLKITESSA